MSLFLMASTSSTVFPCTHSVARLLDAMAEPHPKVLNLDSMILPSAPTWCQSAPAGQPCQDSSSGARNVANPSYLDLQLHDVATSRGAHEASPHVIISLVKGPNVSWVLVMVDDVLFRGKGGGQSEVGVRGEDRRTATAASTSWRILHRGTNAHRRRAPAEKEREENNILRRTGSCCRASLRSIASWFTAAMHHRVTHRSCNYSPQRA